MKKTTNKSTKQNHSLDELFARIIGIGQLSGKAKYPTKIPYNPPEQYPEIPFTIEPDPSNKVYALVRDTLRVMGYDSENFGTSKWNPLSVVIKEGDKVVLKPNWVLDVSDYDINALITNMSVVRAIADYAWKACGPSGRIDILESAIQNTDWNNLMKVNGADKTVEYLQKKGVNIDLQDIRTEWFVERNIINILGWRLKIFYRKRLPGTKRGNVLVDLGKESSFHEVRHKSDRFRGIQRWTGKQTKEAHNEKNHKYSVPREIIDCNVFINLPKLKTHRKAGVTLTLKNLVGMVSVKDTLPHYVEGTPKTGGDEAPHDRELYIRFFDALAFIRISSRLGFSVRPPGVEKIWRKKIETDLEQLRNVRQANWYGGDTVWRMVYDLNKILLHSDVHGKLHVKPVRKYFGVIDGIIAGEKFGPLNSIPKPCGVIIMGVDPVLLEFIGTRVMGYDEKVIKTLSMLRKMGKYSFGSAHLSKVIVRAHPSRWEKIVSNPESVAFDFIPPPGWKGHIERARKK